MKNIFSLVMITFAMSSSALADGGGYNQSCSASLRCSSGRQIYCNIGQQNTSFDSSCTSDSGSGYVSCVAVSVYDRGGAPIASYSDQCP